MPEGLCHSVVKGEVMALKLKLLVLLAVFMGGFVAGASYVDNPTVRAPMVGPTASPSPATIYSSPG